MMNYIPATPLKLRSGAWGVKIQALPGQRAAIGSIVVVRTRAGKTWEAVVDRIVWQNTEVQIAETVSYTEGEGTRIEPRYDAADGIVPEGGDEPRAAARKQQGCPECQRTAARRSQIWEECDRCGAEPIYV